MEIHGFVDKSVVGDNDFPFVVLSLIPLKSPTKPVINRDDASPNESSELIDRGKQIEADNRPMFFFFSLPTSIIICLNR